MNCNTIHYSRHAFERMFERAVTPETIEQIITQGETIASYPDDRPYPSELMLGFDQTRAVHVVVARDAETGQCHVVTVYVPDPVLWDETFKRRKKT
ncbi:MAG: DUF4258 domain-containing protein [Pseudomonadota bacterium]